MSQESASRGCWHAKGRPINEDEKESNSSVDESRAGNPPTTILPNESFVEKANNSEYEENESLYSDDDSVCSRNATLSSLDTTEKLEDYVNQFFAEIKNCDPIKEYIRWEINPLNELVCHLVKNNSELIKHLGDYLNKLEIIQLLTNWMKIPRKEYFEKPLSENIYEFLTLIWSCSDAFVSICESIVNLKFHCIIIEELSKPALGIKQFEEAKVNGLSKYEQTRLLEEPIHLLKAIFNVLYNIMRKYPCSRSQFREEGLVDACLRYLPIEIREIKAMALVCISFAADLDESIEIIQATESNLLFLKDILTRAFYSAQHRDDEGYSVEEMMECFSRLAKNHSNAIEMTRMGILEMCMHVLEKEFNVGEIKWTLNLIWSLCFVDEIKDKISDSRVLDKASSYIESSSKEISEAARGIIWELGQKRKAAENTFVADEVEEEYIEGNNDQHIMISYSWKQQDLAIKIFNQFKQCGQKVWLDIDGQMAGDSLEKMAEAVEKASFVIFCFSEDYKNSQACRSEATYAYKRKKNIVFAKMESRYEPNGWLGLILGADIYYNLFDAEMFDHQFTAMIDYMNKKSGANNIKPEKNSVIGSTNITSEPSLSIDSKFVVTWSSDEVINWFNAIGLSENKMIQSKLIGLNGEQLHEMQSWLLTSTTYFLKFCENKLELSDPLDLIKFSNAVRKLK